MRVVRAVIGHLRGRDLPLHAAAITFYGGIAVVPAAVLAIRLAALLAGPERFLELTAGPVDAVPSTLGADRAARALVHAGVRLSLVQAVAALVPATLYGEGLRRAFTSFAESAHVRSSGPVRAWRGRILILPVLAAGPGLLLALLLVLPFAANLLRKGGWASVGGVIVSFLIVWIVLSVLLTVVYRLVGPVAPAWWASAAAATITGANLSGFAHGFVLFWAIPVDLGIPFGGFEPVGAVVAIGLWLYLLHTLALVGYVTALMVGRLGPPVE
ncbi:YhjD/YihY/BrkB family envelope integrity protein [Virgisporangium aliadipatigenens]|nr:YhjD/YihY/BrkB family envelope integrity protein [Virgisporangium aliadipatigenens]